MIYLGNIGNTQTKTFVDAEFMDFAHKDIDLFTVDHHEINAIADQIENDRVIIYYTDEPPNEGLDVFFNLFDRYPDKKFCMLGDIPNWNTIATWPTNVEWIYYSFSLYSYDKNNAMGKYKDIACCKLKHFDSDRIGISLNRLPRSHRLGSISYMLGIGLDEVCVITAPLLHWHLDTSGSTDIMDFVPWDFEDHDDFKNCMLNGWERAKQGDGLVATGSDAYPPYDDLRPTQKVFANADNYTNNLLPWYRNSFVEFVNVNVFEYSLPWICEKMLNSQLASNFPIWIAGKGTVAWLRNNNFDVFDDIVNHSYDLESNPVVRIQKAIHDNKLLLQNPDYTKELWLKHHKRFDGNVRWHLEKSSNIVINGRKLLRDWIEN